MDQISLWGENFTDSEASVKKIIKKIKNPKKIEKEISTEKLIKSKRTCVGDKLKIIEDEVYRILGQHKDNIIVIKDYDSLVKYFDASIDNGIISIDTETDNSLNTFDCKIMGLCIYTPGQKWAYVPVNHVKLVDPSWENPKADEYLGERLEWQITESQLKTQLQRLLDNQVFEVYHNATFDIEVIKTTCDIKLHADWDTMVGAQLLNENELKGLKVQYKLHVDPDHDKYDIEHLFNGLPYAIVDPDLFALYAATDAGMTYDLYEYQRAEFKKPGMEDVYNLFQKIEIPILDTIVDMELTGVEVDLKYASRLSEIYHKRSSEVQSRIDAELERLKPQIDSWRLTKEANTPIIGKTGKEGKSKNQQLADPPELGSSTQMAIILYDILKVPVVDKKSPRGTGAEILKELEKSVPLCKLLLEKREVDILINTFIDAIPTFVQKDGRVHARFNTCGTQTGRFSSTTPNLQQIPSHDSAIRLIFKASDGYSIVGADYSGQEMRVLASVANDKEMISAYENNQDIYAKVASLIYKNDYEDNLEFRPGTGEHQPDGKKRRSSSKQVALGLNYGMSTASLAERLGESLEEAQKVVDGYYGGLSGVKKYTDDSQAMLRKFGYVTDIFGRRRHIPDAQLPEYDVVSENSSYEFNPMIGAEQHKDEKLTALISKYKDKLENVRWKKDRDQIIEQAKRDGLTIKYNGGFISRAMRQCLNARIQGSSASMTKLAMIMANNDPELKSLGFRLLVTVHDEMYGECPRENGERCGERLCEVMVEAAKVKCGNVPWKCDPYVVDAWYEDEVIGNIKNDFEKSQNIDEIKRSYNMFDDKSIELVCNGEYKIGVDSIKYGPNFYQN